MADLPRCSNPKCPRSQMVIDREEPGKFTTLACLTCNGVQIITQDNYRRGIRRQLARRGREGQAGLGLDQKHFPMYPRNN